ncbi:MAG: phosphatidylserine/phosphatidylglycerophosphate/cardiolipin synthase family protein [Proteobacteria bacterium]|nr:phosphatidylserine/phosphatidylglycerophosphate/cardiolipin synthase family protein [Pseudomonadota bacterium]
MFILSLFLSFTIFSLSIPASAQSLFVAERGVFKYSFTDVEELYQTHLPFLERTSRAAPDQTYKITRKYQFQLREWYTHDWYELQELFAVNLDKFIDYYQADSFNQAKINFFSQLKFSKKHFYHRRPFPFLREWGGLNHPPLRELSRPLPFYASHYQPIAYERVTSGYFDPKVHQKIDEVSSSELSFGNKIKVLEDFRAFEAKKRIIKSAKETILMSSLVFVCDPSTQELTDLLIEKKKEGVDVRVLVDKSISTFLKHKACVNQMKAAGINVILADDFWKYHNFTIYHTKNLVVDFKVAIAGGSNMIDADNTARGVDFKNRDIDLEVTGPMVTDMALAFLEDWTHFANKSKTRKPVTEYLQAMQERRLTEREQGLRGEQNYQRILENPETRLSGVCRYIKQSPYQDGHSIGKAYLVMLDQVQSYLAITNPINADTKVTARNRLTLPVFEWQDRFVMFNKLFDKIQGLAKKDLKIDYITTNIDMAGNENVAIYNERLRERVERDQNLRANWDLFVLNFSNRFYGKPHYQNLLQDWVIHKSVSVWTHMSFIHSKIFHFDRIAASVGSYNFQHNATDHSYEATAICQDETLNRELDRVQVLDMANSIPLVFLK